MLRLALALLLVLPLVLALSGCKDDCKMPSEPPVREAPLGLPEPLSCNEADGQRCCSWVWSSCMHTFCTNKLECRWEYKSGIRLEGSGQCLVPQGYVQVVVTPPDYR